jgi:hypothetical protein
MTAWPSSLSKLDVQGSDMAKKKSEKDLEILHQWLDSVGANISFGESALRAVETSKSGDKLTIVLKKNKPPKPADPTEP